MPDPTSVPGETSPMEVVQEAVKPVTQEAPKEAAPKETTKQEWSTEPPQWAKDLGAKVDGLMDFAKNGEKQEPSNTTVKETVETDLPTKVVAPKKPHIITRLPKWL